MQKLLRLPVCQEYDLGWEE